ETLHVHEVLALIAQLLRVHAGAVGGGYLVHHHRPAAHREVAEGVVALLVGHGLPTVTEDHARALDGYVEAELEVVVAVHVDVHAAHEHARAELEHAVLHARHGRGGGL